MFNRRVLLSGLIIIGLLGGGALAIAKTHRHHDAHGLLGARLHQNGRHQLDKIGNNPVTADISNNKVVGMNAGNLPLKKLKSTNKMASITPGIIQVAATGEEFKLAQAVVYYYGYCFDTGDTLECYWYPADDVVVTDAWGDYVPAS